MRTRAFLAVLPVALALGAGGAADSPAGRPVPKEHRVCDGCHAPHKATARSVLLVREPDLLCLSCHQEGQGGPLLPTAGPGSAGGRLQLSRQPRSFASQHLWSEAAFWGAGRREGRPPSAFQGACVQCHTAHGGEWSGEGAARTLLRRAYAWDGRRISGAPQNAAQVCFGCHFGDPGQAAPPDGVHVGGSFSPSVESSHRIGSTGRPDLPSLRGANLAPLDCGSCHDSGGAGGLRGPHVSDYPKLLVRRYTKGDGVAESPAAYALCYGCHRRDSILGGESFPLHREHLLGLWEDLPGPSKVLGKGGRDLGRLPGPGAGRMGRGRSARGPLGIVRTPAACSTCHDPHGSQDFPSLVAFDRQIVYPNSQGRLIFVRIAPGSGTCNLLCHGFDHVDERY